jgi:hypothetical protein
MWITDKYNFKNDKLHFTKFKNLRRNCIFILKLL